MPAECKVLFINKGIASKTLSRSDGAEKSRIFSHVQRPPHSRLPISSPSSSDEGTSLSESAVSSEKSTPSASKSKKSCSKALSRRRGSKRTPDVELPSPSITLGIAQIDLGENSGPQVRVYMNTVLEFYSGAMIDRIYPNKLLADVSRQNTLSYASHDAVALNAILCTTSGALYMSFGDAKHGYYATYFKGQAIHHLKQALSGKQKAKVSISTLYAVSLLLWVECLQGDMEAVDAHIKGLEHLLDCVPRIQESPLPILTTVLSSSYYCAAMLGSRPLLKPPNMSSQDGFSLSTLEALTLSDDDSLKTLGTRFFSPFNAALIGPTLMDRVSEQQKFIMFKQLSALGRLTPTYEDIQCVYNVQMTTEYKLLELPFSGAHEDLSPVRDAVRLALYIHFQPIITVAKPTAAFSRCMAKQLKEALERSEMCTLWDPSHDLLLWVLFVGAQISRGQEEWPWLVSHIAMIAKLLDLDTIDRMEDVLFGFYYTPRTYDCTIDWVWEDVQTLLHAPES